MDDFCSRAVLFWILPSAGNFHIPKSRENAGSQKQFTKWKSTKMGV